MCCWNGDQRRLLQRLPARAGPSTSVDVRRAPPAARSPRRRDAALRALPRRERQVESHPHVLRGCPLDAGGLTLHWLTGVRPADSVGVLARSSDATERSASPIGALSALAMHREPAALDRLVAGGAADGATTHVRGQALFWLAQRAGDKAVGVDLRSDRRRSGNRGQAPRRVCAESAAEGRRRAAAHPGGAHATPTPPSASRRCSGSASPTTRARSGSSRKSCSRESRRRTSDALRTSHLARTSHVGLRTSDFRALYSSRSCLSNLPPIEKRSRRRARLSLRRSTRSSSASGSA